MNRLLNRLLLPALLALLPLSLAAQTLKIATLAPEGSPWLRELRQAGAEVEAATEGRVKLKYYPGGVMGNDATVLRKMRLGQLQGGMLTGSELSILYKDAQTYSLPFLFNDLADVDAVRQRMDPVIEQGLADAGVRVLGMAGVGLAYLMSTKPVRSAEDLRAAKVWVPQNDLISEVTFRAGGVSPVSLPLSDVFTSLQTGQIDTVGNTPSGAILLQWHGRLRYLLDIPLAYVIGFLVINERDWAKLSEADQGALRAAAQAASRRIDMNNRSDDEKALAALRGQGLTVIEPDAEEIDRWRSVGVEATEKMVRDGVISQDVLDGIRAALDNPAVSARSDD
jgi:TRAP-type C4-dicarboxylate transport system substrate-binding protein